MPSMLLDEQTTVLLTGATSGVGEALSRQLTLAGHRIIAVSRTASTAAGAFDAYPCDLSDPAEVVSLCGRLQAEHPDIRVIINNAAVQHDAPLAQTTPAQLIEEAMLNLVAPALIAQAFAGVFRKHGERTAIVNVSSGLAFFPKEATSLYCATKAGLHSLSQSLRYQCEGSRTLVCEAILPLVATPMTEGRGKGKLAPDVVARAIIAGVQAGRPEIYVGKARLLPLLRRLSPALAKRVLRGR
jgi:uncharacterized oxidoreductase